MISTIQRRATFHLEVGCCQHQNTPRGLESIHLSKKLVEGVVAHTPAPKLVSAPHRVQLIDEDDARCSFPGSFEEGTHTLCATPIQLIGKLTSRPDMTATWWQLDSLNLCKSCVWFARSGPSSGISGTTVSCHQACV